MLTATVLYIGMPPAEELPASLSAWTRLRLERFPEPPWRGHRCGGCGHVTDDWRHPQTCDRRSRSRRDGWNAYYDDLRGDPKRARLHRKYRSMALVEMETPERAWWVDST